MIKCFTSNEDGASLVEYAVALVVVTVVGGATGALVANDTGAVALCAAEAVSDSVEGLSPGNGSGATC